MPPPVQSIKDEAVPVMGVTWCGFILFCNAMHDIL